MNPRSRHIQGTLVWSSAVFVFIVLFALVGPALLGLTHEVTFEMSAGPFEPPSRAHLLGTNGLGQDALGLLLIGTRTSLLVGVLSGLLATLLGAVIGLVGGYKGGLVDNILTSLTNLLIVVPQLVVLVLLISTVSNRSYLLLAGFIGVTAWVWVARSLRARAVSLRESDRVALARMNGLGTNRIIVRHVLPFVMSYVSMAFVMQLGAGIFAESALSMLGLGPRGGDTTSLGVILHHALDSGAFTDGMWWVFLPPTALITVLVYSLYMFSTSLENVFNPRGSKGRRSP